MKLEGKHSTEISLAGEQLKLYRLNKLQLSRIIRFKRTLKSPSNSSIRVDFGKLQQLIGPANSPDFSLNIIGYTRFVKPTLLKLGLLGWCLFN